MALKFINCRLLFLLSQFAFIHGPSYHVLLLCRTWMEKPERTEADFTKIF